MTWYNDDDTFTPDTLRTARRVRLAAPAPTSDLYHGPDRTLYIRGGDGRVARINGTAVDFRTRRGTWTPRRTPAWGNFRA